MEKNKIIHVYNHYSLNLKMPLAMKISFTLLFCIFLQLQATNSVAQRTRISMNATNATIGTVLNNIERNSEYVFLYSDKTVNTNRIVSLKTRSKDIRKILDELFEGSDISYKIVNKQIILKSVQHNAVVRVRETVQQQADFIVKGTVRDEKGEPLIGVSIKGTTATGAISDIDGNFSLKVREGERLTFSYVGYTTKTVAIAGNKNLNIVLSENTKQLNEVVVTALGIKKEAKSLSYNVQQLGNDAVMGGTAQSFYEKGIRMSFSENSVGGADNYVANSTSKPADYTDNTGDHNDITASSSITIAWDSSADFETNLERIITQKWIAMYPDGPEGWSEFRRTGYPKLFPVVTNNSNGTIDTNIQVRRCPFPTTEYDTNKTAVQTGISALGGLDNGGTKLWWDKK